MATITKKQMKAGEKATARRRVNKAFINSLGIERGGLTANQKVSLTTLSVKNVLQRVNNRTLNDINQLTGKQCTALQRLLKEFVVSVDSIIIVK